MREKITQNFSELISLVNQRKLELNRKIDGLEIIVNLIIICSWIVRFKFKS